MKISNDTANPFTIDKKGSLCLKKNKEVLSGSSVFKYGVVVEIGEEKYELELVKQTHNLDLSTNVWTVNDPEELKLFLEKGIDLITTDEPELLLNIIKE